MNSSLIIEKIVNNIISKELTKYLLFFSYYIPLNGKKIIKLTFSIFIFAFFDLSGVPNTGSSGIFELV
jgi:hypothetical protein